jgi:hypothetical protein
MIGVLFSEEEQDGTREALDVWSGIMSNDPAPVRAILV